MLRNITENTFNNHLVDIITNKLQVAVTKNNTSCRNKTEND